MSTADTEAARIPVEGPQARRLAGAAKQQGASAAPGEPLVEEDLVVEEISIDGMCGVY